MEQKIIDQLSQEKLPDNIIELRDDIKEWLRHSRTQMKDRHCAWDKNYQVYRGERVPDEQDLESRENDEPEKMVVPMTYTQVMTFVTFVFMLYKQNKTLFEFDASGGEDNPLIETSETFIERELRHNEFDTKLFQILLDVARFGFAVTKTTWKTDYQTIKMEIPSEAVEYQGLTAMSEPEFVPVEVMKHEGSEIVNVSPWRILPDLRLPLSRWKEGQFVADEEEYHICHFKDLERDGLAAGTKYVSPMTSDTFKVSSRGFERFTQINNELNAKGKKKDKEDTDFMVISSEGEYKLIPRDYDLGDEDYPVKFIVTMLNDDRIVAIERSEYLHDEFIYDIAQFSPDNHAKLNLALADTVDALQDTITWLFNSRIISLRQGLDKHMIVDPSVIDMASLEARSPIITVKKGAPKMGLDKFFAQLKVSDPTVQNIPEAETLMRIMQLVTGVNENAMGQYAPGRRSATENRAANQGAASRMVLHARLIWVQLMNSLGLKLLSNGRQGISRETFDKVIGTSQQSMLMSNDELFDLFAPSNPAALIGNEDFFVFDGTNSSEKQYMAQTLQELTIAILSNPEMQMSLEFDINKLIQEQLNLKGIRNVNRLKKSPEQIAFEQQQSLLAAQQAGLGAPAGPTGGIPPESTQQTLPLGV